MNAENASLGDERRARREEYGHGQWDSESRGFAGFGSNGFDSADGSNGATNRTESVPDRGYTWTPAPLSTQQQNPQNTGGAAALDPFAAWNTSSGTGDDPVIPAMNPADHEPNPRFTTAPADDPPYLPDDGVETTALPTRSTRPNQAPGQADSAALPRISQPGAPSPTLSSSSRIPAPGAPYQADSPSSGELTVPSGDPRSGGPAQLSGAATTQLPTTEQAETPGSGMSLPAPGDPGTYQPSHSEAESFGSPSADTGSLPSWLSSIGEEPVPHPLESGGRRRKLDPAEPAESADQFNPFEDQHLPERTDDPAAGVSDPYELPGLPDDPTPPEQPAAVLPTRASRSHTAAPSGEEDSAAPALPARRLPRSAARHAPAENEDTGARDAHLPDIGTGSDPVDVTRAPLGPDDAEPGAPAELPARRLPRSASRYTPGTDDASGSDSREPDSSAFRAVGPVELTDSGTESADPATPPRLAPPADSTPILDRLLDPEPAHNDISDEEAGAPVAEILSRILESEQEPATTPRLTEPRDPAPEDTAETASESPNLPRRGTGSPLTLVPDDESGTASDTHTGADDSRPPLETRRSRRAREAAEASTAPLPGLPEQAAAEPAPALSGTGPATPAEPISRHSRSEEGADIDIHLIMRLLTASDDLEILAGKAEKGEMSADEVARTAREARSALLSAISAWYGGPAQMVKFANALLQAARES
ncbi:hypothetical protein [Nocardia sp. NPDC019395]|uniref:hypothetical protein n=1 Tax=Nocardia sp. NPDC019395 TaxID=3154686 RepID=UPI003400CD9E